MKLFYANTSTLKVDKALFEALLEAWPKELDEPKQQQVELLLTDDEEIQKLNKEYRGKDKATDVLSFNLEDDVLLGQIIISVEQAQEQAQELGQSLDEELRFLFVHGVLHLMGYDHQTPEEEKEMLEKAYQWLGRTTGS